MFKNYLAFLSIALFIICTKLFAADPTSFQVGDFTFIRPEGWQWVNPTSPMRKAELKVPNPNGGEPADVTFFHFGPGQGGSADANIDRWLRQFQEPLEQLNAQTATLQINDTKVVFLSAEGTFLSGMPGEQAKPLANYGLRGAILSSSNGDVYVKMTGPQDLVDNQAKTFENLIQTAHK